jgi:hypothetical protein
MNEGEEEGRKQIKSDQPDADFAEKTEKKDKDKVA